MKKTWLYYFFLIVLAFQPTLQAQTINATVDPSSVLVANYEGWGTTLCWWANVVGGYANRDTYMSLIFTTLKLNIIRYNIGGGENPGIPNELGFQKNMQGFEPTNGVWDWNADANQRWVMREAIALGANHVEAFANSPPWWMTVSGSVTGAMGNNGHNDNLQTAYETNFASYLATVVSNLTVIDGVHFNEVTPMNEPEGPWGYATTGNAQEGCHMDSGQQARMVNDLHAALIAANVTTTGIDAPETYSQSDATTALNAYGSAANYVTLLTAHDYGGANPASFLNLETSLNKPGFCEEYTDSDGSGISIARRIHDDITIGHERAWITWQAVDDRAGFGFLRNPLDGSGNTAFTYNEKFYVFGQFSEYIRPGFQIININDNYSVGAFNPTNHTLIIVAVNDTSGSLNLNYNLAAFNSLPATVSSVRTSATENLVSQPAISVANKSFAATLIAKSVTTFILNNVSVSTLPNQTVLTVSNSGFELPGTGKISSGFATIPGWANAGATYTDSGVETAPAPHGGAYSAYCKGSDGGAYQIVNYQMNAGDTLTLTWWAEHSGGSGSSTQAVSMLSAPVLNSAFSGTTIVASANNPLNGNGSSAGPWTQYTLTYQATAADAGKFIGIYLNNATAANWAGFDDFSLTVVPVLLPSPWTTTDIGAVGVAGSAAYTNGLFTIKGSGSDIWGGADAFRYVYQPASGDCSIRAKVLSVQNTAPWAKAGVMIRETTNANSTYAIVFLTPVTATSTNGVAFQQRASTGGSASGIDNTAGLQAPYWVQLARTGNSFVGSYSANGTNWTAMATNSITMATNVYIGLPVCSVNNSALNTSTFTNVTAVP